MARKKYKRDPRDIELALATYTVVGLPVVYSRNLSGVVDNVWIPEGHPQGTQYRIRLDDPMAFERFADLTGSSRTVMDYDAFVRRYRGGESLVEKLQAPLQEMLKERGLSERDMLYFTMMSTGCIDLDQMVQCFWAPWNQVRLKSVDRGSLVEYVSSRGVGGIRAIAGRVYGIDKSEGVVYLELFEPIPIMTPIPDLVPEKITKDFMLDVSWGYGRGLYKVLKDKARRDDLVPAGEWTDDGSIYRLSQGVPISEIEKVCKELYPRQPACIWQALTVYVIPLAAKQGDWHPLRMFEAEQARGVVQYETENPWD